MDCYETYKPFFMALEAFQFEHLDSHHNAASRFGRSKRVHVDPSFKNTPEATFTKETVGAEVFRGDLEIVEAEGLQIVNECRVTLGCRNQTFG